MAARRGPLTALPVALPLMTTVPATLAATLVAMRWTLTAMELWSAKATRRATTSDDDSVMTWEIGVGGHHCGVLKLQLDSMTLAAHRAHGGKRRGQAAGAHGPGPCRLNRPPDKGPIGMLAGWLRVANYVHNRFGPSMLVATISYAMVNKVGLPEPVEK